MRTIKSLRYILASLLAPVCGVCVAMTQTPPDSLLSEIKDGDICLADVHVRCNGKQWSLLWDYVDEDNYCSATVSRAGADFDGEDYGYATKVRLTGIISGEETIMLDKLVYHQDPECSIRISRDGPVTIISAGDGQMVWSGVDVPALRGKPHSKIILRSNKPTEIRTAVSRIRYCVGGPSFRFADTDELYRYLAESTDSLEGIWEFMERDISNPGVKLGGFYRLAVVKEGDGYTILYLDGKNTYSELWQPLYIKGNLKATRYLDHYDLEWITASRDVKMYGEMWSTVEAGGTVIAFHLPLLKAVLKFRKV